MRCNKTAAGSNIGGIRSKIGWIRSNIGWIRSNIGGIRSNIGWIRSNIGGIRGQACRNRSHLGAGSFEIDTALGFRVRVEFRV